MILREPSVLARLANMAHKALVPVAKKQDTHLYAVLLLLTVLALLACRFSIFEHFYRYNTCEVHVRNLSSSVPPSLISQR